jgi:hypothetical protein
VLVKVFGSLGCLSETGASLARVVEVGATPGSMGVTEGVGGSLSVLILAYQPASLPKKLSGGGSTVEVLLSGVEDNMLVAWSPEDFD